MQSGGPSPGKRYRFNSPPGWPTYPPEWVPPPGWVPDPRWPAAPPGWPFWSEIAPPEKKPRRGLVRAAQITAGILSFLATVIGLGVVIHGWLPKDVKLADWQTNANRTCDKYYGRIYQPTVAMFPQITQEMTALAAGKPDDNQLLQISQQVVSISAAYKELSSDLGGIQAPKNQPEIAELVTTGQDISDEYGAIAVVFTKAGTNQATQSDYTGFDQVMTKMNGTSMPDWIRLSSGLKLDHCEILGYTASSASPTPPRPPSPTPAQLTADQQALVAQLKSSVLTSCQPAAQPPVGAVAVNCHAVAAGTTKLPAVIRFQSQAAMNQWMSTNWQSSVTGLSTDCAQGDYDREWTSPATNNLRAGLVVCKQTATNDFTMAWTFDSASIAVVADGTDGPSLFQWWKNNAYLIATS